MRPMQVIMSLNMLRCASEMCWQDVLADLVSAPQHLPERGLRESFC